MMPEFGEALVAVFGAAIFGAVLLVSLLLLGVTSMAFAIPVWAFVVMPIALALAAAVTFYVKVE